MTFVNWPDKELRPVADSISFSTNNIGSDIQWNRFSTLGIYNVFKLQTFLFLVNVHSWDTCRWEARTRTNFWVDKGKWIAVDGALKRKKRVLSLLMFKALKWNMFPMTAYKDVIFMRQFRQSATNRYQSISIYLLIVIENRYQSITTQILAIDGSSIIHINSEAHYY